MLEPHYHHLKTSIDRSVLVLTITTPLLLDEDVADALRHDLLAALDCHAGITKVVLNFHNVRSLSAAVFRPLISLNRLVTERNGRLLLCGLSPLAAGVLRLSDLLGDSSDDTAPFEADDDLSSAVTRLAVARLAGR
jgi:anti-anti-sigma factor